MSIKILLLKNSLVRNFGLGIKRVLRNIKFLFTDNLYEVPLYYDIDIMRRELAYELPKTKIPLIKSLEETFEMLINTDCSFCRFGDGEFENILQHPSPFSNTHLKEISVRLIEVLRSKDPKICIGLPLRMYTGKFDIAKYDLIYWRRDYVKVFYQLIEKYCIGDQTYYASEVTLPFCYQNTDFDSFFRKARQIWDDKDITIIASKNIFKGFKYNIFDNARSIEKIDAPSENAFATYAHILQRALQIKKNRLVIIILGQTATILAYDLAKYGYRALDLGHIAKAYEWYRQNKRGKSFSNVHFFLPD